MLSLTLRGPHANRTYDTRCGQFTTNPYGVVCGVDQAMAVADLITAGFAITAFITDDLAIGIGPVALHPDPNHPFVDPLPELPGGEE